MKRRGSAVLPPSGCTARATVASAAIAFLCSPVPLLDEIGLAPLYAFVAYRVGRRRDLRLKGMPWSAMSTTIVEALVVRAAVGIPFAWVPIASAAVSAATAVTLTPMLVGYFDEACRRPELATPADLRVLRAEFARLLERIERMRVRSQCS